MDRKFYTRNSTIGPPCVKKWRRRWFTGPPELRRQLWKDYGYDRRKYVDSYKPGEEAFDFYLEAGMDGFIRLERRLLRHSRMQPYYDAGQASLERLGQALSDREQTTRPNVVLVSIDFEGQLNHKGINEFGWAKLDTYSAFFALHGLGIESSNYALQKHRRRKFLFGNTTRIHTALLSRTIVEDLQRIGRANSGRDIVLVCHGLPSELSTLEDLGIMFEDLPFTGVVDTQRLSYEILGHNGSLKQLLMELQIPWRYESLHNAGNDANYTLRVAPALLEIRLGDPSGRVDQLAREPLPAPQNWKVVEDIEHDWFDNLDGEETTLLG